MSSISELHQAAIDFAEAGIPVFPCVALGKTPATKNGFKDATTNLEIINGWWTENPAYNVAFSPGDAGWLVVDVDPGAVGQIHEDLPPTYAVQTPRGGRHYYFEGIGPSSASKLAEHVDTRGIGGYVLAPPSRVVDVGKGIDGVYKVIHETELAPLPDWVSQRISDRNSKVAAAVERRDLPGNVGRARHLISDLIRAGDVAIEGQGGDARTYRLACEIQNLGLTEATAYDVLKPWNDQCRPPWSDDELRVKIENASQYSQNEAGAWAVPPAAEAFDAKTLDRVLAEAKGQEARSKFYFADELEMEGTADPGWIVPDLIPQATTVLLYGKTGSFKSFLAQDILMSVAAKKETFGALPAQTGPTFYGALEGRNAIKKGRRNAWKLAREVDAIPDFYVGRAPIIAAPDEMQQFGDAIAERCQGKKPRLIVLDTISKCMTGLNENDAGDASKFIRFCDSLVEAFGCSVIAIGHSGKDDGRGHRGSSAFQAGFDTTLEVIRPNRHIAAVSVHVRQHKDAPEREMPWTFEGREMAGSLVFFPTDPTAHRQLTMPAEDFAPKKVGAALQNLNAYGLEQGVTTIVLAAALIPSRGETEDEDSYTERHTRAARALASLAKTKLEAYALRQGRDLLWSLPAPH